MFEPWDTEGGTFRQADATAPSAPDGLSVPVAANRLNDYRDDLVSILQNHPACRARPVIRLAEMTGLRTHAHRSALIISASADADQATLQVGVDVSELLKTLCGAFVEPLSPLFFEIVPGVGVSSYALRTCRDAIGRRWVDPIRSAAFGRRRWLEGLLANLGGDRPMEAQMIYACGWWEDWYQSLFGLRWDARLVFHTGEGFLADGSCLDAALLDADADPYRQSSRVEF